ncbi:hypothetical protein XF30_17040 [Bradyrhizobium sp. SUTN9-2]|uniref:hypothetical protein n=1 Tax=Bradyrhizobium sp. SUTN9-2 TaxID=1167456 RepID=UPI000D6468A5|nr:hypothetical protein [Bradyrhizobium sp. SUTN9-2]PWE78198.1 hypothetical protein XF30_17040 [Bradyrhizobium sp. SUTN9-2]
MIHAPNLAVDRQLLHHSWELVREAMALLRKSDHLVSAQRLRDDLEGDAASRCPGGPVIGPWPPMSQPIDDQNRCANASHAVTARHRITAA